ncbi:FCD domain [Pannonibacter indicus]|uniref:FCD domain n=1 Tax=Pannonibacter indicus TaxID=466044 RepID=A0A0K6HYF2_9HYPH|nr:FCD domain [Pannonibacter indicus]
MQEHRDILNALEAGDTAAAERLMRSHIQVQTAVYGELRGEFAMRTLEQASA